MTSCDHMVEKPVNQFAADEGERHITIDPAYTPVPNLAGKHDVDYVAGPIIGPKRWLYWPWTSWSPSPGAYDKETAARWGGGGGGGREGKEESGIGTGNIKEAGGRNPDLSDDPEASFKFPPAPPSPITRMSSLVKTLLACSLLAFVSVHARPGGHSRGPSIRQTSTPVVTVKNGTYGGVYSPEYDQDFFLGMRYAQVCHLEHPWSTYVHPPSFQKGFITNMLSLKQYS